MPKQPSKHRPVFAVLATAVATTAMLALPVTTNAALASNAKQEPTLPTLLASGNRAPLMQIVGLPLPLDLEQFRAQIDNPARPAWWRINVSNASLSSQSSVRDSNNVLRERILQDGEMARLDITARWMSGRRSGVVLNVPLIAHHSGNMDQAIERWHSLFGLPNSNRDIRRRDSIEYVYERDGQELMRLDRNVSGLGDLQLEWQTLLGDDSTAIKKAARLGVKLPTGDKNKLTGSGAAAAHAEFSAAGVLERIPAMRWQLSVGAVWMEGGGVLNDLRRPAAITARASLAKKFTKKWQLQAQLEGHSRIYRSSTDEIGRAGLQLSLGAGRALGKRSSIEIYFTEDVLTRSSPDVGIGATLRHRIASN
ncbi:MAG: DUF3187 family protein [Gammaproteobacteria bacterium]|nr:DUF3187 family protein [Gammaproteobacteria bacterium]MBT8150503.1 DUF3187 family protein [Gammaproteobacteria bacterium]NNM10651.1 DUF3187 family protein [Pseudomonadales bacterium]